MNKIFKKLTASAERKEGESRKVSTSGKLFDWCNEKLKPLGLHVDSITPYSLGVYRGKECIGYYNTLSEVKQAIKGGYVSEPYNL